MATVSFDEKVVITDKNMVAKMKKDLADKGCVNNKSLTNNRKW